MTMHKYSQDGLLGDVEPGERIRNALSGVGERFGDGPDVSQTGDMLNVPDNPGPAVAGRTPLIGTVRRSQGMPVLRDQINN